LSSRERPAPPADAHAPDALTTAHPRLAGPAEAHNTVKRDNEISAHPELKLARWAARELDSGAAARVTLYTSCQPCGMCVGGIVRSGLGRVVYALSNEQFARLNLEPDWPAVTQEGPALFEEARLPLEQYYRPAEH
jgi:tRNA(Arg) A34 adenosine deaminase TadA